MMKERLSLGSYSVIILGTYFLKSNIKIKLNVIQIIFLSILIISKDLFFDLKKIRINIKAKILK
jgi:hypothetical protein